MPDPTLISDPIKPKVDDGFWFTWSETLVTQAPANYDRAAAALQGLAAWAWGIYTAATAIGFGLAARNLSLSTTVIIGVGSVLLLFTYWMAVWVQAPPMVRFDPRIPADIRAAYVATIETKRRRLRVTKAVSVLAAIMVAWGLMAASMPSAPKPIPGVLSALIDQEKDGKFLLVTVAGIQLAKPATLPARVKVEIKASGGAAEISPAQGIDVAHGANLLPTREGLLQLSFPITSATGEYSIVVQWMDTDGQCIQLSRIVKLLPSAQDSNGPSATASPKSR